MHREPVASHPSLKMFSDSRYQPTPPAQPMRSRYRQQAKGLIRRLGLLCLLPVLSSGLLPNLSGQCTPTIVNATITPSTIVEYSTQVATLTVTINCSDHGGVWPNFSNNSGNVLVYEGTGYIAPGQTQGSLQIWATHGYTNGEDRTYTVTATVNNTSASAPLTVRANVPTISIGPNIITGGVGETAPGWIVMRAPLRGGEWLGLNATPPNSPVWFVAGGDLYLEAGKQAEWFAIGANSVTSAITFSFTPTYRGNTGNTVQVRVIPAGGIFGGANLGPCKHCMGQAGAPINLGVGNVWVQERDYTLPGLAGGLEVVRTWNSMWEDIDPYGGLDKMFGYAWRSNYDERLAPWSNYLKYWRGDGSSWAFLYNDATHQYSLATPIDERATLIYDSISQKYTLTFADGTKKIFNYPGYLISIADRNGNQTTLTRDGSNRLTQATDAAGRVLNFRYNNPTFSYMVSSIDDATGTIAQYTSNGGRQLTRVTYADNSYVSFTYDVTYMLTAVRDTDGKLLESHTYDADLRGLSSSRANGADSVSATYPPITQTSGQAQLTDSMGRSTSYGFQNTAGRRVITSVSGAGCSSCGGRGNQTISYDGLGNVTSKTDALGRVTTYTYDTYGNVLTKSVQLNPQTTLTWTYTYNSFNQVLTARDPLNNVTTNTYDTKGNLLSTTTPPPAPGQQGLTTSFTYDTKGQLTRVTDPRNNQTNLTYTTAGLIQTITDAQNNTTTFEYSGRGNRTASVDALNNRTTYTYNVMNRLTQIVQPGNLTTTFTYDTRGRRTSVTDANSKVTSYGYDDADRLLSVTDAASHLTAYGYDTENHLAAITDAMGRVTSFGYDSLGRVTSVTFPSELSESYTYDDMGNLLSKTDRKGQTISYTYDNLDRLTSKEYPDSSDVTYVYDNLSRLTQASDASGTYGFSYDNLGRLTGTATTYSFLSGRTLTNSYSYDAASNRVSMTDPEGGITSYAYDNLNRLTGLTDFNSNAFGFGYDSLGRRTSLTRPNGVNTGYTYDNLSRLLSVIHALGGATKDGATYTYDNVGNRTSKTFVQQSDPDPISVVASYGYDNIYQLTQTLLNGGLSESYSFDDVGNRTASLGVSPYLYNNSNELTSTPLAGFSYDENGNTTSKTDGSGTTNYTWDYENHLVSVSTPSSGTVNFAYDPFGRRIFKSSATGTSIYAYDGDNVSEELDSAGNPAARYAQGLGVDEPLAMYRSGVASYFHADGLGSVTSLSDGSGAVAASYVYDSFGNLSSSTGTLTNSIRYTAREFDSETGLYYYRARYYDPAVGRFLSEDPIQFSGGPNFYVYVWNGPIDEVDPSGLFPPIYPSIYRHARKSANLIQSTMSFLLRDLHDSRRMGHDRFPGERNSAMRHCTISCELGKRWPNQIVRAAGVVNEMQGLIIDVRNISSRISGRTPEAAQVRDLIDNEHGFGCVEKVRAFRFNSCEECCANPACSGGRTL